MPLNTVLISAKVDLEKIDSNFFVRKVCPRLKVAIAAPFAALGDAFTTLSGMVLKVPCTLCYAVATGVFRIKNAFDRGYHFSAYVEDFKFVALRVYALFYMTVMGWIDPAKCIDQFMIKKKSPVSHTPPKENRMKGNVVETPTSTPESAKSVVNSEPTIEIVQTDTSKANPNTIETYEPAKEEELERWAHDVKNLEMQIDLKSYFRKKPLVIKEMFTAIQDSKSKAILAHFYSKLDQSEIDQVFEEVDASDDEDEELDDEGPNVSPPQITVPIPQENKDLVEEKQVKTKAATKVIKFAGKAADPKEVVLKPVGEKVEALKADLPRSRIFNQMMSTPTLQRAVQLGLLQKEEPEEELEKPAHPPKENPLEEVLEEKLAHPKKRQGYLAGIGSLFRSFVRW